MKDKYPAYVSWDTFEKIQALLSDNHAEYDRNKTRGVPRDGQALLHGLVYCGECGHKMVVQYKNGTRYICNFLRQQHGSPVCQYIPAVPVDAKAVAAFFEALAPAELEALAQATERRREADAAIRCAQAQQLERLRYRAALAERQFDQVDPDNRLVAGELERRWETALIEVRQAETALTDAQQGDTNPSPVLDGKLRAAFIEASHQLPDLWQSTAMTTARKKAFLRCLLDKIVLHRAASDTIHMRLVWRGGDVTVFDIPVAVGSLAALARSGELEARVLELARAGKGDRAITATLSAEGHRSPMGERLLPSTVQTIRLRHGVMTKRSQSHPRRIDGCLTVTQLASRLGVEPHWIYDRIHKGTIAVQRDAATGLYLFPDRPGTLGSLEKLKAGTANRVTFNTNAGS